MPKQLSTKKKKKARSTRSATKKTRRVTSLPVIGEPTRESVQEFTDALSRLIEGEPNAVQGLWQSVDDDLRYLVAEKVGFYLGRWSEEQVWYARGQRGFLLKESLKIAIRQHKRALRERLTFERTEVPHWGYVHRLGRRRFGPFSDVILSELEALKELLLNCRVVFSKRRLGTKRTHDLILLRFYVEKWMERRGRSERITIAGLAALVDLGWRIDDDSTTDRNTAENLVKDLARFEKNPRNSVFLHRARDHAWWATRFGMN